MNQNQIERRKKRREARKAYHNPYGKAKIKPIEKDNMGGFTILVIFLALVSCVYILVKTYLVEISVLGIFKLICLFMALAFLIPIKWYRKKFTMSFYEYSIFNVIAISPMLTASFLLLNTIFSSDPYVETYAINSAYNESAQVYYRLENQAYEDEPFIRTIGKYDDVEVMGSDSLSIYFSDGLFGMRNILGKRLH